jgi:anionic cell wall polymer biosynthesis LytR-Cps2A-Psr (LCP) family protein
LYSAVIPGVGQLVAGVRRRGFILLAIFLVVSLAGVIVLTRGVDTILGWVVQPKVLLTLLWVNIIIMLVRMFAVIDAWLTAKTGTLKPVRPSGPGMLLTGAALVLILVFTVAPHAVAGYYTVVSHDLLTSVFASDDGNGSKPSTTTGRSTDTSGNSPGSGSTVTTETTTTTAPLDWGSDGRMTILLVGTDAGFGRTGARADSINVATIDLKTGNVAIFGLPRNTGNTPLGKKTAAALGMKTYPELLNSLYTVALKHPEIAPDGGDPGAEAIRETASLILGIPIDYYAVVNMMGLVDMVDALRHRRQSLAFPYHLPSLWRGRARSPTPSTWGVNHLDEARLRSQTAPTATLRSMGRQRCVIMAMLYQNGVSKLTLRFPKIASALQKSVNTNIPVSALPELIRLRSKVNASEMIAMGFTPPDWISGYTEKRYNVLDFPKVKAAVRRSSRLPTCGSPSTRRQLRPAGRPTAGRSRNSLLNPRPRCRGRHFLTYSCLLAFAPACASRYSGA